jgi:Holliday junction resolvase RusA-like endonuclease
VDRAVTAPLSFTVIGTPAAQGSHRHVGHGILIESSQAVKPWRQAVAYAAHQALRHQQSSGFQTGPIRVQILFAVRAPKALPKRGYSWPWRRPDLDKLLRATFDGLSESGVWHDDAQDPS